jgi:hypothetical protein
VVVPTKTHKRLAVVAMALMGRAVVVALVVIMVLQADVVAMVAVVYA